ncbi:LytR/AlgR family response regulator transcription factor [Thalassotalea hakodatensis]|uniref:LytR/AlgR family response regulator transcription factor n=1 Tax=Thalassotalea hakodatensis TaxID=3030492 RepID=UPI0025723B94|nr:response regulator [Thalassotalea hakodatensis]
MITCFIIDDEPHARERIRRVIEHRFGWQVIGQAAVYDDAKSLFLDRQPNVCFVDVNIIGGNGISLIKELKYAVMCKWVIMSAHSEFAIDGYNAEVEDYLLKPIDNLRLEKLLLKLESYYANNLYHQSQSEQPNLG